MKDPSYWYFARRCRPNSWNQFRPRSAIQVRTEILDPDPQKTNADLQHCLKVHVQEIFCSDFLHRLSHYSPKYMAFEYLFYS
jgi:hypothetical protein